MRDQSTCHRTRCPSRIARRQPCWRWSGPTRASARSDVHQSYTHGAVEALRGPSHSGGVLSSQRQTAPGGQAFGGAPAPCRPATALPLRLFDARYSRRPNMATVFFTLAGPPARRLADASKGASRDSPWGPGKHLLTLGHRHRSSCEAKRTATPHRTVGARESASSGVRTQIRAGQRGSMGRSSRPAPRRTTWQ